MNLVSIIVPCYNYAHFLGEALDSVLGQTYSNWECIIINDGSPDNTEEIALKYCKKDSRFKYLYKENGGHSSARNLGIKHSFGKYILPLDADDKINEYYLEKAVEVLENRSGVKLVTGEIQYFGTQNGKIKMPEYNFRSLLITNFLCNGSLYCKTDYDSTKGYDETMLGFEDWNFWISLLKDGGDVVELPFVCYYYRKKEDSIYMKLGKDKRKVFIDLFKIYSNHIEVYQKYFESPLHLIQENEKMKRVIEEYQKTKTYKFGLQIKKIKKLF